MIQPMHLDAASIAPILLYAEVSITREYIHFFVYNFPKIFVLSNPADCVREVFGMQCLCIFKAYASDSSTIK